ncbi:hypothetical protein [Solibacillus cecembensis]|uniref:hypothetical protein n=1 Tax=Solibacillus cecembensis TaxID=459347 RepID=UPI003D070A8C
MYYNDLTQDQVNNLSHLLEYAQVNQLDELRSKFDEIVKRQKLDLYRNSVLQSIMLNNIKIEEIEGWLLKLKENSDNTIIHIECSLLKGKKKLINKKIISDLQNSQKNILDISHSTIKDPQIVDYMPNGNEIELTLLLPAKTLSEDGEQLKTGNRTIYIQKSSLYHVYIWVNTDENTITLSLPSYSKYNSIWDIKNKRNMTDLLTEKIVKYLWGYTGEFEYKDLDWVNHALRKITNEYYYHNNPLIENEIAAIINKKKSMEKNTFSLNEYFANLSDSLNNDVCLKRINNAIDSAIERELISLYKMKTCPHPFEVFLHEISKGVTSYKSRSGTTNNQIKEPPSLDTRDIILKILNSGSLKSLGLKYYSDNLTSVAYKVICKENWIVLEQTNETGTSKELVKNVLSEFKTYKGSEQANKRSGNN